VTPALALGILLMTISPPVEIDGVRIEVEVESFDYTWTVTNVSAAPITHFEMNSRNAYDHTVPEGWKLDSEYEHFIAWTDDPALAIQPGSSAVFMARAGTNGPMLRMMPGTVGHVGSDAVTSFEAWAPGPGSRSMVLLVAVTLSGLAVFHAFVLGRSKRA